MEMLVAVLVLFIGFAAIRWRENPTSLWPKLWVTVIAAVRLVYFFVSGVFPYHWTAILIAGAVSCSIDRDAKKYLSYKKACSQLFLRVQYAGKISCTEDSVRKLSYVIPTEKGAQC